MKNNVDITHLFTEYTQNKLSPEEEVLFRERLNHDVEFKSAFEEFQLANSLMIHNELFEVNAILNELKSTSTKTPKSSLKNKMIIGGGVVLLSALFTVGLIVNQGEEKKLDDKTVLIQVESNTGEDRISSKEKEVTSEKKEVISDEKEKSPILIVENEVMTEKVSEEIINDIEAENQQESDISPKTEDSTSVDIVVKNEPHTEQLIEEGKTPSIVDYCRVAMKMDLSVQSTCVGTEEGRIEIQSVQGANGDYQVSLYNKLEFGEIEEYENLAQGEYTVFVKDEKGCELKESVIVPSHYCMKKHFEIVLSYNQYWEIPLDERATVRVFDRKGELIANFRIDQGEENIWTGLDLHGNLLPAGLYSFIIETEQGKAYSGSVSIYL